MLITAILAAAITFAPAADILDPPAVVYVIDQYPVGDDVDPVADCLVAHGFHGDPHDGREVIYVPRPVDQSAGWVEWCQARNDEMNAQQRGYESGDPNQAVSLWWALGPETHV